LTKLVPALLDALAASADPDAAFMQFDRFLSNLPAGVQLFSLFLARPELLKLVAEVAGSAPKLAAHLAQRPATLDALLDANFLQELPGRAALEAMLRDQLLRSPDYETKLDTARRFAKEQIFRVGVQIIQGRAGADEAGPALADVAECVVAGLLDAVETEMAKRIEGGRFAVIAMGKLGGREMTAASDLDLIFVYDAPDLDAAVLHYARLAQRLIVALTALTGAGGLYEVDMRLRPTGNKGPVAVSLESFRRYHETEAWTWERLALTRARAIAGSSELCGEVEAVIRTTLTRPADEAKLIADAREMREKLAAQFPGKNRWDLKFAPGGLVDIEFIAQTLQLKTGVLDITTIGALKKLGAPAVLVEAAAFQQALTQVLRIAVDGTLDPAQATPGLKALLARAGGAKDFGELEARLTELQARVREAFANLFSP
jgi:glutamate-ammonia-ligase adenylyltransferase